MSVSTGSIKQDEVKKTNAKYWGLQVQAERIEDQRTSTLPMTVTYLPLPKKKERKRLHFWKTWMNYVLMPMCL